MKIFTLKSLRIPPGCETVRELEANLVELTLPDDSPQLGHRVGDVRWPPDTALVAIIRGSRVLVPSADDPLEAADELLFVAAPEREPELEDLLSPHFRTATG